VSGVVLVFALGACSPSPGEAALTTPPAAATPTASTPTEAPTRTAPAGEPPIAWLSVEGGDPVAGQLGTFIWGDGGSDSPWLPGAPIAVGAREPATVTLDPLVPISSWRARYVPSTADGPDGALTIGNGIGPPAFLAPPAGTWTVEVHVVFADGLGDASYSWQLTID
jgi:hypothetical protein